MSEQKVAKSPRQVKTEQLKREVIQATMGIIKEYGTEYVTVSNVCKVTGMSTGSFYHHFGSKEELLGQYLAAAFDQRAEEFDSIVSDDVVENILEYYRLYNAFLLDQGYEFIRKFYTNTNHGLYSRRNYLLGPKNYEQLVQTIHRLLEKGREQGYLAADCDIESLIYELSLLEKGVIFDWCVCEGEYDLQAQISLMLRNYLLRSVVTEKYREQFEAGGK